jgi:hypothetical protein
MAIEMLTPPWYAVIVADWFLPDLAPPSSGWLAQRGVPKTTHRPNG